MPLNGVIRVGLTEHHGMAAEMAQFPPPGVEYSFLDAPTTKPLLIRSPIKGYMRAYDGTGRDLIETALYPIRTHERWIYSCENFQAAAAFSLLGAPLPRSWRIAYITRLLARENCRKVVVWSQAGLKTFEDYGHIRDERLLRKMTVVYPAVREVPDDRIDFDARARRAAADGVNLLFSGDFFRKGGANVIDVFERLQQEFPNIRLQLCCDERLDFNTPNTALRTEYLEKIRSNRGIAFGRIPRDELVGRILPVTDVYLLPTYVETFGFAILEAMAFGIPVISTNYFAIPEMLEHERSGYLIDTSRFDCDRLFRGYVVTDIPTDFRTHVTEELYRYLRPLVESAELRSRLGAAGMARARSTFSFQTRNEKMLAIYREALA